MGLLSKLEHYSHKKYFPYIIIVMTASTAYCNSFKVPFTLDDFSSVTFNHSIHKLFCFSEMWQFYANRIVLYFTMSINYVLLGNYLEGYHIVNLLIHILNGILLFSILVMLLGLPYFEGRPVSSYRRSVSLLAALLFICHPIEVNAVTYIIQRTASLAAAFYMLSVFFYLKYRITGRTGKLAAVFLSAVTAMFTKENTITIPFMLLLIEIMFFSRDNKLKTGKRVSIFILLFSTVPIIPVTNLLLKGHSISDPNITFKASTTMSRLQYFYTQLNVLLHYIRLLIFPIGQNFDYSNDYPISTSIWENNSYLSFAVLLAIFVISLVTYKRNRLVSFGILWFFICISVESSFISIKDVYFEHRVYLPSAGFIMFLAGIITYQWEKTAKSKTEDRSTRMLNKRIQPVALFVYIALILLPIYTALTIYRNYIYSDSIRLWSDTVKKAPNSDRAHNSLATAYLNAYDEHADNTEYLEIAENEYKKALEINEENSTAHSNLSKVYLLKGMYQQCIKEAKRALELSDSEYAQFNLGSAYMKIGRTDDALSAFLKGYRYNDRSSFILKALGDIYYDSGDLENAQKYYEKYIDENYRMHDNTKVKERLDKIEQNHSTKNQESDKY